MAVFRALHRLLLFALLVACSGGNGESGPDAALAGMCPEGVIEQGGVCALAPSVRCMIHQDDCALSQVCTCEEGFFSCEPTDFGEACGDIEDALCSIEGVHGCTMYPPGGMRNCVGDQWVTSSSCPEGCPGPDATEPQDGDACTVADGEVCPYADQDCECVGGEFRCCETAPCAS